MEKLKCKVCGSENIIKDSSTGEYYCADCGAVIEENVIDLSQEWRAFSSEQLERRARTGVPFSITESEKELTTQVGKGGAELMKVPTEKRYQYYRLQLIQRTYIQEKYLNFAKNNIERICSVLKLSENVKNRALYLYKELLNKTNLRGKNSYHMHIACVYYAAKELHTPRTLKEISETFGVDKRKVAKALKILVHTLNLKLLPSDAKDFIPRFCSLLNLDREIENKAYEIYEKIKDDSFINIKSPAVIASAIIFVSCLLNNKNILLKEIAEKCNVTEISVRELSKYILEKLNLKNIIEENY